jgi:hypothetical protein
MAHMRLKSALEYHEALGSWAVERLVGKELSANHRIALPAGCFDVAVEHQNAIVVLCENRHFGSAFALIRVIFEACVRGVWLHRCATEQEVTKYQNDTLDKKFYQVLQQVEKIEGFEDGILGGVKSKYWNAMNSFTHTGILQVSRRLSEDSLGPHYTDDEILEILGFSGAMCLFAAQQIALLSGDLSLANQMLEKMVEFANAKF